MHTADLLHRDVKPSNIFIDHDGAWRLGDFDSCCYVGQPIYSTTNGFHATTTRLDSHATFALDWGMLLCTTAVLMTPKSGKPLDTAVSVALDSSGGKNAGHMQTVARDTILATATGRLTDRIAKIRQFESESREA